METDFWDKSLNWGNFLLLSVVKYFFIAELHGVKNKNTVVLCVYSSVVLCGKKNIPYKENLSYKNLSCFLLDKLFTLHLTNLINFLPFLFIRLFVKL